MAMQRLGKSAK